MSWTLLISLVLASGLGLAALVLRRRELRRQAEVLAERADARRVGADQARLQHPVIDLSRCLGCGTCVDVCPEGDVLQLLHGQAAVINGGRCAGVAACARECPVGAITITLGDLSERDDVPVLAESLEAVDTPGLYLAGEVTAHALIKTAVEHGTQVAAEVAGTRGPPAKSSGGHALLDLAIVGAGPAGLACALEARRRGLAFTWLEQEQEAGGTVARYPRRKLVLTQPVDLPLHGRLEKDSYSKEELIELWARLTREHELPLQTGSRLEAVERDERGAYQLSTSRGEVHARNLCLALGRRGTPVKLGVPGEELPKVAYHLIDAQSYRGRRVLVVGGGDSAVEAALGLAEQPGTEVSLSYRRDAFTRIRSRNARRLQEAEARRSLLVLRATQLVEITPADVAIVGVGSDRAPTRIPNDEVFVMAGGTPPFALLESAGVSFDAGRRAPHEDPIERGTGLVRGMSAAFLATLLALLWVLWHADYYALPLSERPMHSKHQLLRPGLGLGLWLGVGSVALVVVNLAYVLRRWRVRGFRFGSLETWMSSHVATGVGALLLALLHSAMAPRETVGGQAFWALAALLLTGAIGRYVYAFVPRATNGRELALDELRDELSRRTRDLSAAHAEFADEVRREVSSLVHKRQWGGNLLGRLVALAGVQLDLRRVQRKLRTRGEELCVSRVEVELLLSVARRAHRSALGVAHFEDLRGLLSTWRYLHRWVAALMVVLVVLHIVYALSYGDYFASGATL